MGKVSLLQLKRLGAWSAYSSVGRSILPSWACNGNPGSKNNGPPGRGFHIRDLDSLEVDFRLLVYTCAHEYLFQSAKAFASNFSANLR